MMRIMNFIIQVQRRQRNLINMPLSPFVTLRNQAKMFSEIHEDIRRLADDKCLTIFAGSGNSKSGRREDWRAKEDTKK